MEKSKISPKVKSTGNHQSLPSPNPSNTQLPHPALFLLNQSLRKKTTGENVVYNHDPRKRVRYPAGRINQDHARSLVHVNRANWPEESEKSRGSMNKLPPKLSSRRRSRFSTSSLHRRWRERWPRLALR